MINPFDTFENIYCLNLECRQDRWQQCLQYFEQYEINKVQRFLGFEPPLSYGLTNKRKGQIGCATSICNIFSDIKEKEYKSALILEDDFEFLLQKEELFDVLNECLNDLPEDWDMFYLGGSITNEQHQNPLQRYSDNLYKLISSYTTHAFAISKSGILKITTERDWAEKIINAYEAVDIFLARDFQIKNNCFFPKQILATQRPDFSSIEGTFYNYQEDMIRRLSVFSSNI